MVYPNHLPGSAGFQIKRFLAAHNVSPYLGYIEPTEDLRHIIFCAAPCADAGGYDGGDKFHQEYCATYNGYLYHLHEGRFLRLWVDMGYCNKRSP
jgi:hypothetical protein